MNANSILRTIASISDASNAEMEHQRLSVLVSRQLKTGFWYKNKVENVKVFVD